MKRLVFSSLRLYLALTVLFGLIYPGLVTALARGWFFARANGALVTSGGRVVGARLIAQPFTEARYLHPRPSAVAYDPRGSGASNAGRLSADLATTVEVRRRTLGDEVTPALLTASASGLDPDLDLPSAFAQVRRVARARGLAEAKVRSIIEGLIVPRQFGLFGEPRVNVLMVNVALDESR